MYSDDTLAYVALKVKDSTCSFIPVEFFKFTLDAKQARVVSLTIRMY